MSILNGWNGTYIISNTWNCQILGILDSKGSQFPQRCLFSSERRLISCKQSDAPMQTQRSIIEEKKGNDQGLHDACRIAPGNAWQSRASCKHEVFDH